VQEGAEQAGGRHLQLPWRPQWLRLSPGAARAYILSLMAAMMAAPAGALVLPAYRRLSRPVFQMIGLQSLCIHELFSMPSFEVWDSRDCCVPATATKPVSACLDDMHVWMTCMSG
jgi:hypothetical protein